MQTLFLPGNFLLVGGHSTEDQLLLTYSNIVAEVDQGREVDAIYLDYSKAFDVIKHSILNQKLHCLGFSTRILGWIRSFLCDRTMCVSIAGLKKRYPCLGGELWSYRYI